MSSTRQAGDSIHEEQFINFLVDILDAEIALDLSENVQIDAEDFCEVLVGASTNGASVSTLCKKSADSPHQNTVLYHLREKFDFELQTGSVEADS